MRFAKWAFESLRFGCSLSAHTTTTRAQYYTRYIPDRWSWSSKVATFRSTSGWTHSQIRGAESEMLMRIVLSSLTVVEPTSICLLLTLDWAFKDALVAPDVCDAGWHEISCIESNVLGDDAVNLNPSGFPCSPKYQPSENGSAGQELDRLLHRSRGRPAKFASKLECVAESQKENRFCLFASGRDQSDHILTHFVVISRSSKIPLFWWNVTHTASNREIRWCEPRTGYNIWILGLHQ